MAWEKIQDTAGKTVWRASEYADLQYDEINNLAEYRQPRSPDQAGFDHDFIPDFQNVIIQIPHHTMMDNGHGKNIRPTHFPIINQFLNGDITVQDGTYSFIALKSLQKVQKSDRTISGHLYGFSNIPTTSGTINAAYAAYIYGSVGYALKHNTRYEKRGNTYVVQGEMGVIDDNWDFISDNTTANILNPLVAVLLGPDHYNLEPNPAVPGDIMGRIEIEYIGPGKPFRIQSSPNFR